MLRRTAPALFLLLLGLPGALSAQYFGRNKVQYTNFDFKVIQTEHFDVYFYERERVAAMDAARMAERSYARLSKVLNHEFRERKPIILYASHSDFMQTNATQVGGEGTGGVTDFARNRAVMPFTGSYADFEHVLMHEMAHQFQYDVWSRGRAGAGFATLVAIAPPLWFAEGMAEYLSTGPINAETAMWLRDASLEGKLPTIDQMTVDPYEYFPYRFGHALWSYVAERSYARLSKAPSGSAWTRSPSSGGTRCRSGTCPRAAPGRGPAPWPTSCSPRSGRTASITSPPPSRPTGPAWPTSARRTSTRSTCTSRTASPARSSAAS